MEKSAHMKRRMTAELCSCVENETSSLHMEFKIPGVRKKDIDLKLNHDGFNLKAENDDFEYVSCGTFCCPVEAKETKAKYKDGLLNIKIPLKDRWKDAHSVSVH